jgi:hypothetical protein
MRRSFSIGMLAVALCAWNSVAWADSIYRCSDGTFTNRVDRNCAPFDSKVIGRIQAATSDRIEEGKRSVAEVKLYRGTERDIVKPNPTR